LAEKDDRFFSWNNLRSMATLIAIIFAFRWSVAAPYHVPTASMEPSIKVGDRVLANHLAFHFRVPFTNAILWRWSMPERGDIVVFDSVTSDEKTLVKRVVAVGGDLVELRDGLLTINGDVQKVEPVANQTEVLADAEDRLNKMLFTEEITGYPHYMMHTPGAYLDPRDCPYAVSQPLKVPDNHIFVMGDNRENSRDSRCFGIVSVDRVYGRATRILWSMYFDRAVSGFAAWKPEFRFYRFGDKLI
jgi:signal peptidase I